MKNKKEAEERVKEKMKIVYCAIPSRFEKLNELVISFVINEGCIPFNPLVAFPRKYFEDNPKVGRKKTMTICKKAIEFCDEFWYFGKSKGTLNEMKYASKLKKQIKFKTLLDAKI